MKRFQQTKLYSRTVAELNADVKSLEEKLRSLEGLRGKEATKSRTATKALLKSRANQLRRTGTLEHFTMWDLVHMEAELRGTLWSDMQVALWDMPTSVHEGKGEKSIRDWHGLAQEVTQASVDLQEINEEVKNWHHTNADEVDAIQSIRIGKIGKAVYGRVVRDVIRSNDESVMDDATWDALVTGEVSPGMLYHTLPEPVTRALFEALHPARVLMHYSAINGCSRLGFLRIPVEDAERAWRLKCVTQASPKYDLRRSYVEELLNQDVTPVAAGAPTSEAMIPPSLAS